jgi:group I intron endonuclease
MPYTIYKIVNKITNKSYIGKSNNVAKRWQQHKTFPFSKGKNRNQCLKLYRAIRKYGVDNFDFSIIQEYENSEECDQAEINFIKEHQTIQNGYNITSGGTGPSGPNHPWYGKHHTEESKKKSSISHTGKKLGPASNERKKKISEALTGKEKPLQKGENNHASKLEEKDIPTIRTMFDRGISQVQIAKLFGVSNVAISCIIRGKTWKHII